MYKIFISALAYDKGQSGISDYINNVVNELAKQHQLDILIMESDLENFPVQSRNIKFVPVSNKLSKPIVNMMWHLFAAPLILNLNKYDFVFLPAANRRLFSFYSKFTIATFHDLSQFHIPMKYDKFRMFYIRNVIPFFIKKAPAILAVSEATKKDLIRFYNLQEDRITVAYNGYNHETFNNQPAKKTIDEILGFKGNYILYVARIEHPGKNHLNLIKAYEQLPEELRSNYKLVLAGGFKERSEEVKAYAEKSSCRNNIIFTGFFPKEDISDLYKNASLFVMPSFFEGFGIPLVEAMSCRIPVICSNRGPLPEVTGQAALHFNPDLPLEIADNIIKVLQDRDLQEEMKNSGEERCKLFSWQRHAEQIIELFTNKT